MIRTMKIGSDFDDVIADLRSLKAEVTKEFFGIEISPYAFVGCAPKAKEILSPVQYSVVQKAVYRDPKYAIERLKPVTDAFVYIPLIKAAGHEIIVPTNRDPLTAVNALNWLRAKKQDLELQGVGPSRSKLDVLRGAWAYVDDEPHKLMPMRGAIPHLFHFSDADDDPTPEGVTRVRSWRELFFALNALYAPA